MRHYSSVLSIYDGSLTRALSSSDRHDLLLAIDRGVHEEHQRIAAHYGQQAKDPNYPSQFQFRWMVNFLTQGTRPTIEPPSPLKTDQGKSSFLNFSKFFKTLYM